jgi:hypothetical protein
MEADMRRVFMMAPFCISNLGLAGEWENGLRRLRTFLQKGSKNSKNLQKNIVNIFFESFGDS